MRIIDLLSDLHDSVSDRIDLYDHSIISGEPVVMDPGSGVRDHCGGGHVLVRDSPHLSDLLADRDEMACDRYCLRMDPGGESVCPVPSDQDCVGGVEIREQEIDPRPGAQGGAALPDQVSDPYGDRKSVV